MTACGNDSSEPLNSNSSDSNPVPVHDKMASELANLLLYVSNQSFADDAVEIAVTIDGEQVVNDRFTVQGQHNWVTYPLNLSPGAHQVEMTSSTGVSETASLELPADGPRYATLSYWYYPPDQPGSESTPRSFHFEVSDSPMGFD